MARKEEKPNMLQKLKEDIRQDTPGRLYFFYGEEVFLLDHYLKQLQKSIIDPVTESFNFHKLTNETFDIQALADCVENLPMMAERTMTVVDEIDIFKLNESDRDHIADILSDIGEN
jgi:DNA polymerase-3 subunit delta